MSSRQTDNDETGFGYKVKLRAHSISKLKNVKVLDCFAGHGWVWQSVKSLSSANINVTPLDKRDDKTAVYLKGDNLKFIKSMDLSKFDVIDLDAFGTPVKEIQALIDKNFKGIVHVTFIQSVLGSLPRLMLTDLGYTKTMIDKCPTLFYKNGFEKLCKWLKVKGLRDILYIQLKRKTYLYCNLGE